MNQKIRLCDLPLNKSGVIITIDLPQSRLRRLMDMGIMEGTKLTAAFRSISKTPIAFRINNTLIALRASDCKKILITPQNEAAYA